MRKTSLLRIWGVGDWGGQVGRREPWRVEPILQKVAHLVHALIRSSGCCAEQQWTKGRSPPRYYAAEGEMHTLPYAAVLVCKHMHTDKILLAADKSLRDADGLTPAFLFWLSCSARAAADPSETELAREHPQLLCLLMH